MSDALSEAIVARVRAHPQAIDELVALTLDHLLDAPVVTLLDPAWLARAVSDGLRASARSPHFESWVHARVEDAFARADELEGPLADKLPITLLAPLEHVLSRELVPDRELVEALLDHSSVRELIREILHANILEFGRHLRAVVPEGAAKRAASLPGMGLASRLAGVAKDMASAVGGEVERQLEGRVHKFVDEMLGATVDMAIVRLSAPEHAGEMARWRVDVLHAVLQQPLERLVAQTRKYPADQVAADLGAFLQALAGWRDLATLLEEGLGRILAESGHRSVRAWLAGSGLEDAWRPQLEEALSREAHALVASDAFADWLARWFDE